LSEKQETMLAVTVDGGPCAIEVPKPERKETSDVLIKIDRIGICGTDLAMFRGYNSEFHGIVGHEFSGTVVDSDQYSWLRRRVTSSINLPADLKGTVDWKTAKHAVGRRALGIRGIDGVMAEYAVLPEGILVAIPDNVSSDDAALAEPLAAAIDSVDRLPEKDGQVLVIGDGKLAQLTVRVLLYRGYDVSVWGHHKFKLDLMEKAGARILSVPAGKWSFSQVIEISGSPSGFDMAFEAVKPEGTIIADSVLTDKHPVNLSRLVVDEISIVGSRCGDISDAMQMLSEKQIEVNDLITDIFPLADAEIAFERSQEKDAIKVLLST